MTSKRGPTDRRHRSLRVWTYAQARAMLPYVASIMSSLREHRLDFLRHQPLRPTIGGRARQGRGGIHWSPRKRLPARQTERMRSTRKPSLS